MYVVIFRATIAATDQESLSTAEKLRKRAMQEFGCTNFTSLCEGNQELTLSYWPSLEHIARWRNDPEHQAAQIKGRRSWYRDFQVEVAKIHQQPGK